MSSGLEERYQTLHEIVRAARATLAPGPWDYLVGGAETETTLRRNRLAIDSLAFRPRVLRDVSKVDASSSFLGKPVRLPVMFAPIGSIESFTPGGGATAAQASAEFGVPQMLSSVCNPGLEAVAKAADSFRVFQLYVRGDAAFVDDHVRRAVANGYPGFCITVDGCFQRGTDVVKAIALGADLVGMGRMPCFGLAAAGAAGAVRVMELLEDEIRIALALLGVDRWAVLDASYLHPAPPVTLP